MVVFPNYSILCHQDSAQAMQGEVKRIPRRITIEFGPEPVHNACCFKATNTCSQYLQQVKRFTLRLASKCKRHVSNRNFEIAHHSPPDGPRPTYQRAARRLEPSFCDNPAAI